MLERGVAALVKIGAVQHSLDKISGRAVLERGVCRAVQYSIVADLQIYNTSLTQQQVQQLYAQGLPLYAKVNVSLS